VLDGDAIRSAFFPELGFGKEDRSENRAGEISGGAPDVVERAACSCSRGRSTGSMLRIAPSTG
jgi:hypothetical protein